MVTFPRNPTISMVHNKTGQKSYPYTLTLWQWVFHGQVPLTFSVKIKFSWVFDCPLCRVHFVCLFVCLCPRLQSNNFLLAFTSLLLQAYINSHYCILPLLLTIDLITVISVHTPYFLNYPRETWSFQEWQDSSFTFSVRIIIVMRHLCPHSFHLSLLYERKKRIFFFQ